MSTVRDRAVVLVVAGIGWELGPLAGLDVRLNAGLCVRTSAGAAVAAQITSGLPLDALIGRFGSPDSAERPVSYDITARGKYLAELEDGARDEPFGAVLSTGLARSGRSTW